MKQLVSYFRHKSEIAVASVLAFLFLSQPASAVLPTAMKTAFDAFVTDVTTIMDTYFWPVVITVAVGFVVAKLARKAISRAT